ncbi:MAG: wax ester/triacylglycerol synthase family O-acyltransferase [Pseudomonadales bacterium]
MQKLGALDASFLYNETASSPQHIASIQILELPEGKGEAEFVADLKSLLMERIHLVPYFTNKLQFVPFNLDHPVWVKDRQFHIDHHVHTRAVPAPGDRAALEAAIAELHETRLDRSRPLWDLWVLTGLEGGRVAYYNRAHHACLDGMAGQAMIETIMDVTAEPREVAPAPEGFFESNDSRPLAALISGALENFARYQSRQPLAAFTAMETSARLFRRALDPSKGLGAIAERAPRTRFNRAVGSRRVYATGELPLDSVKAVAGFTRTKINDVFLAVCAGGLRRYFERTGELPRSSLIAGCPVSLRQPGDENPNNQVTMMMVSLATNEPDAGERLQDIARSARTAKEVTQDLAPSYDSDVALPGLPGAMTAGMQLADLTRAADVAGLAPPCNVVISNVPGPQVPLYSCGARVLTHYPVSIPAHTQAVNITVQSYNGALYFGVTGCARALQDPAALRDDLLDAFEELRHRYDLPTVSGALQQRAAAEQAVRASKEESGSEQNRPEAA